VALAYLGHEVTGVDTDPHKLALLQNGKSPIHEPGLAELMHHSAPNLTFTNDTPLPQPTPT
jgi:UDPglucose 6-dehydrogenase